MKIKNILLASLLFTVFACRNDKVVPTTVLLTVTVDALYLTDVYDDWILIHAEDGTLLASESFESDQELEITTTKPVSGKIMVTHLQYYKADDGNKWYSVMSYANVETGKHMFFKAPDPLATISGKLTVSVSDVNSLETESLSSRIPTSVSSGWDGATRVLDIQSVTLTGISKYLVTVSDGNALKYRMLNNVQPNDSYSFSFNDMDVFNHTVDFSFPQSNNIRLDVYGGEPNVTVRPNEYFLLTRYASNTRSSIQAGYVDILTTYRTVLTIGYPGYSYYYQNLGSIPDGNVSWPQKADFNITDKSIAKFSATTSKPYVRRLSGWSYNDAASQTHVAWNVSASSGNQLIKELPAEITSVHPALALDNLNYSSTTFYTESPAFESLIDYNFKNSPEPNGVTIGINIVTD